METHKCKICSRRFSNGKAMGGHMRSHLAKLPIPKMTHQPADHQQLTESTLLTPSSSSSHAKTALKSLNNGPDDSDYTIHDRESDTESSPKNPTRRRSKRTRKFTTTNTIPAAFASCTEPETTSSVCCSDTMLEEEVAFCLIMLSKDKWSSSNKGKVVFKQQQEETDNEDDDEKDQEEDNTIWKKRRGFYKCETCKKMFKSYQALGGHRASHKKIKTQIADDDDDNEADQTSIMVGGGYDDGNGGSRGGDTDRKIFQCPFCFKVFGSGQALGGHKKVHFSNNANYKSSNSAILIRDNWIDLNLPAPPAEEDEDSTVSNAEGFSQFEIEFRG